MRIKSLVITAALLGLGITYGCEAGTNTISTVTSLNWTNCEAQLGGRAVCADLSVPFSYKHPRLGSFTLKVAMQPAVNPSNRYLFVNLGGPGVVATDSINGFPALNQNINIISFDPRGIGNTDIRLSNSPVLDCGTDEENLGVLAKPMYTPLDFDRAAWISRSRDYAKEPLNKSVFLLAKTEVGRFFSHRFEKFGFWLMNPRYLLPFWGFPHTADGLLPSCQ